ncbi:hypothetical protein RRG08_063362 [Elysia crispata]|uniref:Uncharacterized protein n=1 Tax=Elysia crispata TaxID=231223 RepID=A0AAE1B281_9GAST|nr:hypothetical protein RRG08_063362 [Elysia crispata]
MGKRSGHEEVGRDVMVDWVIVYSKADLLLFTPSAEVFCCRRGYFEEFNCSPVRSSSCTRDIHQFAECYSTRYTRAGSRSVSRGGDVE